MHVQHLSLSEPVSGQGIPVSTFWPSCGHPFAVSLADTPVVLVSKWQHFQAPFLKEF